MTDERDRDDRRLSAALAESVLERAAVLEHAESASVSVSRLRAAALEAGIGREAFEAALAVALDAPAARHRPPAWVRLYLTGVPDRRTALGYYWLFVVALCASPLLFLTGMASPGWAAVTGAFLAFAVWSTGQAVRWFDRFGWDVRDR